MQAALVAGSAVYGAYAQNEAGKAQQSLANQNAKTLDAQAEDAIQRGQQEVHALRRRTRGLVGNQRVQAALQGIDVNSGVAMDLQDDSFAQGAIDEAQIRENALDEAWGIRRQASNQRLSGNYARRAGRNQAAGTVLGGIGESARAYYTYDRPKIQGAE